MANSSYLKDIILNFKPNEDSVKATEKLIDSLGKKFNLNDEQKKSIENLRYLKNEITELKGAINLLGDTNDELINSIKTELENKIKEYEELVKPTEIQENVKKEKSEFRKNLEKDINTLILEDLSKVGDKFVSDVKQLFKEAWSELNNTLQYSLLSNAQTRNLAFNYGFSSSQSYGFSKALSVTGLDEESLMYANAQQLKKFKTAFEKYSTKYEKLYDSGLFDELYEYQVEMEEFKEDLTLEVVEFFVNNKETIKFGMNALGDILKVLMEIAAWLPQTYRSSVISASDTLGSYSNTTTNVSISNTFNGIGDSQQANLTRLGAMTTEQLKAVLGV